MHIYKTKGPYQSHVRIYTDLYFYLYLPQPETGYMAPINLGVSQKEAARLVAPLAAGIPALSPQLHGPLSAVGVLICGLARPTR